MAKKALRLIGVNKKYKISSKEDFQALYDITVDFEKGELVSIVGESGSGKSTLMNLIGGLDSDFTGQIIADGENLGKLKDKELDKYRKNKVGFVFQSFNLISHLSILDNVTLALTLSNMPEKEKIKKATDMLKRVGLETQLKKNPTQLSGGQKQRVAIARALINDPEIIIADEPTGALDSQTSMQILEILKEIADSGKLVIMVTHSEKVASVSSRVVEISDGRLVSDKINEKYKKSEKTLLSDEEVVNEPYVNDKTSKKVSKDKQNLSFWSAIRLSLHNMWANRVKNFLMAFGVAIGIGSLILMLCFSSGIDDFIDDTMKSYSNPQIVTVTKSGSGLITDMMQYKAFSPDDIEALKNEINAYLAEKGNPFEVKNEHISKGVQMMTVFSEAKVIYNPEDNRSVDYFSENELNEAGLKHSSVFYLYTIPPYYTETNVSKGEMSKSTGGVMLTKGVSALFDDGNPIGKGIDIAFTYKDPDGSDPDQPLIFRHNQTFYQDTSKPADQQRKYDLTITGIMDTSIMANYMVIYIDYSYFQELIKDSPVGDYLDPNAIYIKTDSKETTDLINAYLASTDKYKGSIEDQLANMFSNMSKTIGTSLTVISCISLLVSAMMILVVLYMSVTERTKEIGVMKSIGARRKDIKRIFTSESFLVGVLSGIVGIIFNLFLTLIITIILKSTIGLAPVSYRWWYFALAMGVAIFISMLSGLYPASRAAKLDPVESLRRE